MTTYTDDSDTMGAIRELLMPDFEAIGVKYLRQRPGGVVNEVPAAIVSRQGGNAMVTGQNIPLRDKPTLIIDVYATNINEAHILATKIEKIMLRHGATQLTGQFPVPAAVEAASIRAVNITFSLIVY